MNIDTTDRKGQRDFGLVMAGAIVVVGLIRWAWHRGAPPMAFLYVAATFLVLGLAAPRLLRWPFFLWMKFALAVNWVMTRVLLTVAFLGLIVPTRVIIRLFGKDPLQRAWDPDAATYWEDPEEQPVEFERYFNQY